MYIRETFSYESAQITLLVVSDTSASHLMRKPEDMHIEADHGDFGCATHIPF